MATSGFSLGPISKKHWEKKYDFYKNWKFEQWIVDEIKELSH